MLGVPMLTSQQRTRGLLSSPPSRTDLTDQFPTSRHTKEVSNTPRSPSNRLYWGIPDACHSDTSNRWF
jgi:hypothetical protein